MSSHRGEDFGSGFAEATSLASRFLGSVVAATAIGWLLDHWLGTWPWLVGLGAVGGTVLGSYWMVIYARESSGDRGSHRN